MRALRYSTSWIGVASMPTCSGTSWCTQRLGGRAGASQNRPVLVGHHYAGGVDGVVLDPLMSLVQSNDLTHLQFPLLTVLLEYNVAGFDEEHGPMWHSGVHVQYVVKVKLDDALYTTGREYAAPSL